MPQTVLTLKLMVPLEVLGVEAGFVVCVRVHVFSELAMCPEVGLGFHFYVSRGWVSCFCCFVPVLAFSLLGVARLV